MRLEIGDKVVIRKWDDLKAEFGINECGNIKTEPFVFPWFFRDMCGKKCKITSIIYPSSDSCSSVFYALKDFVPGLFYSEVIFEKNYKGLAELIKRREQMK